MKKRLLSALLALALVFVLLPTTALAGEVTTNGDISIAGKGWNFKKSTSGGYETVYYQVQSNNGVFSTTLDNKTDCVWPTNPYLEITRTGNTITVIVHNEVTITTNKGTNNAAEECIEVNKSNNQTTTLNLVIKGAEGTKNNTLTLECGGYGSALSSYQGGITITGGVTVNAKSTYSNSNASVSARAINVFNGDLTISGTGTTVNAENKDRNHPTIDVKNAVTISDGATLTAKNTNGGKAISFNSITADGYDFMGRSGNSDSYTTLTGDDKATKLQEYSSIQITHTPTPALEKSNVYVAGTNLYKNTAYTIQDGKPVMGGTYPGNYNIYFDATDYVLHVKDAVIEATGNVRGTRGIDGTSDIVFEGDNSITASSYGIYLDFKSSDLKISGTGSLEVKTIAGDPAIATANNYNTSKSIIISGQGFTVTADTSKTTSYAIRSAKDLTIKDGAAVIAKSNEKRAIDIDGDLTVTGATLTATSTSNNVPTVQVGSDATFTGSTVTITNNGDRQGKSGEYSYGVSTGLYVGGTLDIKNAAKVTSTVIGGNAIYAKGDITISGDNTEVKATNDAYKFSAISTNKTVNISDNSTVKAENLKKHRGDPTGDTDPSTGKTYNPCPAIAGKIANKNPQNKLHIVGFTTSSAGSQNPTEGTPLYLDIAPSSVEPYIHHYNVTITRGDEVTRTKSPVVIDGTTLLNDTYYTITNNGSKVAEGTESNYNAFYDSASKTLKLNNAKISTTTKNAAIKISEDSTITTITVTGTNELKGNYNHCIESYDNFTINGTGTLNMTNTNSSSSATSVIHCGPYKSLTIAAEVIIKNEAQPGNLISTVEGAYSFAKGYNVYASTDVSGSPLETYDAAKSSTYKYLCVTKENLAPTTPTPQTPFTIDGIPAQFVDGGMIATTGVTATSSNNINLPIDRVKWYTFTPVFGSDGRMDSVSDKTKATGNFEAGKYYVVEIKFVQDLSPFESWDMKVSGWSDNDVYRQSETARNDIEIYFLTPASAATHEHNWAENYDTVYHWKMCTYDGCTAISGKAPHEWTGWWVDDYRPEVHAQRCNCGYLGSTHSTLKYVAINGEQHQKQCPVDGCDYKIESSTTAHVYAEGSNICTDCGYNKSAPCDHTGDRAYTNNGDGTHKVTCKACGATIVEKQNHEFAPTGACIYCGATQSGGDPTPDNPGTIVIIRPAEEEKPAQQPNPSTGANDLVGLAVAAAVAAALGSAALLRKHD